MAERSIMVCDLEHPHLVEATVHIRLDLGDGNASEFDVCEEHRDTLRSAVQGVLGTDSARGGGAGRRRAATGRGRAGRPAKTGTRGRRAASPRAAARGQRRARNSAAGAAAGGRTEVVRAWARENGVDVKDRGRLPADVIRRYEAAQSGSSE